MCVSLSLSLSAHVRGNNAKNDNINDSKQECSINTAMIMTRILIAISAVYIGNRIDNKHR